jgi:hypothetical protein
MCSYSIAAGLKCPQAASANAGAVLSNFWPAGIVQCTLCVKQQVSACIGRLQFDTVVFAAAAVSGQEVLMLSDLTRCFSSSTTVRMVLTA